METPARQIDCGEGRPQLTHCYHTRCSQHARLVVSRVELQKTTSIRSTSSSMSQQWSDCVQQEGNIPARTYHAKCSCSRAGQREWIHLFVTRCGEAAWRSGTHSGTYRETDSSGASRKCAIYILPAIKPLMSGRRMCNRQSGSQRPPCYICVCKRQTDRQMS